MSIGAFTVLAAAAAAAIPSEAAPAAVVNPSLEQDGDRNGVPDCFSTAGWGDNTATYRRVREGRSGRWAERLTVTRYRDGDRKLIPKMAAGCAPAAVPGQRYQVSVWYRSTVWSVLIAYVLRSGVWEYWTQGPGQPPADTYRRSSLDLPALPAGATAVTFGQAILGAGTITTDDYAMAALTPPATSVSTASSTTATTGSGPGPTTVTTDRTTTTTTTTGSTTSSSATTSTTAPPAPCSAGYVALGFDDGPDVYSDELLDILEAKHAKATHFLIGEKITGKLVPVVQRMVRLGHPVGNHTWSHPHLTELTDQQVRDELTRTSDRFATVGIPRPTLWRPPFEDENDGVKAVASSLGLAEALWDLDTDDWRDITPEETARRVVDNAKPGTITLLHERIPNTVDAVSATIDGLRARGFCLGVIRPSPTYNEQTRSYAEVGP
jgi:peptidoglycan/xylan/chitin deacetylase (PgdA/CDA1 family)